MSRIYIGQLHNYINEKVFLRGWLDNKRKTGSELLFYDLRDHTGIIQVVIESAARVEMLKNVRKESVLALTGKVVERDKTKVDPKEELGDIEIVAEEVSVLNPVTIELPFQVSRKNDISGVREEILFENRYLHMRRKEIQDVLRSRHQYAKIAREYV